MLSLGLVLAAGLLVGLPYAQDSGVSRALAGASGNAGIEDTAVALVPLALGARSEIVAKNLGASHSTVSACHRVVAPSLPAPRDQQGARLASSVVTLPLRC